MARFRYPALATLALLVFAACSEAPDDPSQAGKRGIDQDITATHDAGAPALNNMSLGESAPWRLGLKP